KIILQRNLKDADAAESIPRTWRGDRMIVLKKNNALSILWIIAFTNREAAGKFADTYSPILDALKEPRAKQHRLDLRENAVLIVIGPAAASFDQLAPAVWKATTITPQCSLMFPTDKVPTGCQPVATLVKAQP